MPTKKLDPITRLRRLLLEARDAIQANLIEAGDAVNVQPALMLNAMLVKRIDRALTDSLTEEPT